MFIVMGTVTADLFIKSDEPLPSLGDDGFRSSNLLFTRSPLTITMGGNGGNSAYVLAGLGAETALCGAVGRDLLGDRLVGWLEERGVDLSGLLRSESAATSTSTIVMGGVDEQIVFHHLGSTAEADLEMVPDGLLASARALLVSSFPIMPRLRAGGFARALARVHARGGLTALDIGPAIGQPLSLAELAPLLADVDYLIGNQHELSALTGVQDPARICDQLFDLGASSIVIKQGEEGATCWSARDHIHVPAFAVDSQVTVGAGDAFNAGLILALAEGQPEEAALRFACAVAALVVAAEDGILGSPTRQKVEQFLG